MFLVSAINLSNFLTSKNFRSRDLKPDFNSEINWGRFVYLFI